MSEDPKAHDPSVPQDVTRATGIDPDTPSDQDARYAALDQTPRSDPQDPRPVLLGPVPVAPLVKEPTQHRYPGRGKHKIYVGAAPGVGKTYRALSELQERQSGGADVVIGLLETHGRAETKAAAEGLELLPRRMIEYKGINLGELNVKALIERKPDLVLIDELAHTNAPGSEHTKRYEDVEEILNAGINVVSTLNIQHLESLNDLVTRMTGVRVRERVPDRIVLEADEVVLVDVTPEQLQERLRAGKIYASEKIEQALSSFFTEENLASLRELALRQVADAVEELPTPEETIGRGVKERICVAVSAEMNALRLIRRGARVAQRLAGELHVIHVRTHELNEEERHSLEELQTLTQTLEGEFHLIEERNVANALISFARMQDITQIILGESHRTRLNIFLRGSIIHEVLRRTHDVDVYIIADSR